MATISEDQRYVDVLLATVSGPRSLKRWLSTLEAAAGLVDRLEDDVSGTMVAIELRRLYLIGVWPCDAVENRFEVWKLGAAADFAAGLERAGLLLGEAN